MAQLVLQYSALNLCATWEAGALPFLTTLSTRQVLQALVLSHLDYCSVVWSDATKKGLRKIGIG
jgi:hypothetical protein